MRISPIVLLIFAMLGCGSGTEPATPAAKAPDAKTSTAVPKPIKVVPNSPQAKSAIEAAIRKSAGKPTGELTKADMEKVTDLFLSDDQITDLKPLMELTKLEELHLVTGVTNLKPLSGLTGLENLTLHSNQITDITPLAGLTNLARLALGGNNITDLTPLAELRRLRWLSLTGTQITDLTPLAELKEVEELRFTTTNIIDLTPLAGLTKLESLRLRNTSDLTKAVVDKLQKALPDCEIKHNVTN